MYTLLGIASCPILWKWLEKKGKKPKKIIYIPLYIILFLFSSTLMPSPEDVAEMTEKIQQERQNQKKDENQDTGSSKDENDINYK